MTRKFTGSACFPIVYNQSRVLGQPLFALVNGYRSGVHVDIGRFSVQCDCAVATTFISPLVKTSRVPSSSISGGTAVDKCPFDTALVSDPHVRALVTLPTQVYISSLWLNGTPSHTVWQQYTGKMRSSVEQVLGVDNNILPRLVEKHDFILKQDEALLVYAQYSALAPHDGFFQFMCMVAWEEFAAEPLPYVEPAVGASRARIIGGV